MTGRDHADRHAGEQRADDAGMAQRICRHACKPGLRRGLGKRPDVVGALPALPSALVSSGVAARALAGGRVRSLAARLPGSAPGGARCACAPALLRRRHHQARVGATVLQVGDVEPGDLRRPRAGRRGDLGPEAEPRRDRIGGGNDLAHVALGQSDMARGVRVWQARQSAAPHRGVADARIVAAARLSAALSDLQ